MIPDPEGWAGWRSGTVAAMAVLVFPAVFEVLGTSGGSGSALGALFSGNGQRAVGFLRTPGAVLGWRYDPRHSRTRVDAGEARGLEGFLPNTRMAGRLGGRSFRGLHIAAAFSRRCASRIAARCAVFRGVRGAVLVARRFAGSWHPHAGGEGSRRAACLLFPVCVTTAASGGGACECCMTGWPRSMCTRTLDQRRSSRSCGACHLGKALWGSCVASG